MQAGYAQHLQLLHLLEQTPIEQSAVDEYALWIENGFRLGSAEDSRLWEAQEAGFIKALRMVLGDEAVDRVLAITDEIVASYL